MEKAKKERKYFVETKPYYDALKIIDNKRILLLTGEPYNTILEKLYIMIINLYLPQQIM